MICPTCWVDGSRGDKSSPRLRAFLAIADRYLQDTTILRAHPLYISRELTILGYFDDDDPPSTEVIEDAQTLLRQLEK